MKMRPPIIVVGTPRSGTSLVAGCLHKLGAFVGDCRKADENNPRGYFENQELTRLRKEKMITPGHVSKAMVGQGYTGGPWLVKHTPRYAKAWHRFPNATLACVTRKPSAVLESRLTRGDDIDIAIFEIGRDAHLISLLRQHRPEFIGKVFFVSPDALIGGDYDSLEDIAQHTGLTTGERLKEVVSDFVEPSLWHH